MWLQLILHMDQPLLKVVASVTLLSEGRLLLEGCLARSLFSRSASSQLRCLPLPLAILTPTRSQNRRLALRPKHPTVTMPAALPRTTHAGLSRMQRALCLW